MIIREAHIGDAESISEIRKQEGVRETVLALSSERIEATVNFLETIDSRGRAYVAEEAGKVIGLCALLLCGSKRRRHCAEVSVMVDSDYQGRGVGTALMKKLLAEADGILRLHRIELNVLADNKPAISLYEKLGFTIEALKKSSCIRGGSFASEYLMGRICPVDQL